MSTHTAPIEASLTPEQALLTDHIGNEVYASHYAERKAYRLILGCGTVLLCGSMCLNWSLAHRPVVNRYVRIDEMGRAQAAAILKVHPRTLQRLVHRGEIAAVHVGKLWRFRASALTAWIDRDIAS